VPNAALPWNQYLRRFLFVAGIGLIVVLALDLNGGKRRQN